MHILYIHQHFALPKGSTGTRSYEFAKRWAKAGHQVTVICGHYDLGGLEYTKELQAIDGINVLIAGTKYSNKMSFFKKVLSFISFIFSAFLAGLKQKNVDIIFATSTPLTIGIPAVLLKWFKKKPFVFEVRDEWPRIPVEMGIIKNKVLIKFLYWLERFIYKQSSGVVALSPGMAEGVKNSLKDIERPIVIASNCSDIDRFVPTVDFFEIRQKYGWVDKFVLLHFGAMGKANGLEFLINAASQLSNYGKIEFVLVGDGSEKERLQNLIFEKKLNNIEILKSIPKNELSKLVSACDVSLVIFADFPILEHNSANKFFDSLAAGKPVLLNYSGWQRDVTEEAGAGFGCKQGDIYEFTSKIINLYENQQNLKVMGQNSRKLAEDQFARDLMSNRVLDFIVCCIKG